MIIITTIGYNGEICLEPWVRDDPVSTFIDFRKQIGELWSKARSDTEKPSKITGIIDVEVRESFLGSSY